MKNSILSLKGAKVLSKVQLQSITGGVDFNTTRSNRERGQDAAPAGGNCAVLNSSGNVITGLTYAQASGAGGVHWCCDSCGSASWHP